MKNGFRLQKRSGMVAQWSPLVWFALSAVVCFGLFLGALSISSTDQNDLHVVRVYCASAVVKPLSKIVTRFNAEKIATTKKIRVDIVRTGGSGALAGQISAEMLTGVQQMADVFVCADSNRMTDLVDNQTIVECYPVAAQFPVIAICTDANLDCSQIFDLPSLLNSKLKLGVGSISSAIGFETVRFAQLAGCDTLLGERKTAEFENVMSLAQALSIGSVDSAILWDSTVTQFNQTDNRAIKIVALLDVTNLTSGDTNLNPLEKLALPADNLPLANGSDKFGSDKFSATGSHIKVGRSSSVSAHADTFFKYLKENRDIALTDFIDAGFSNYQLDPSIDNGR